MKGFKSRFHNVNHGFLSCGSLTLGGRGHYSMGAANVN